MSDTVASSSSYFFRSLTSRRMRPLAFAVAALMGVTIAEAASVTPAQAAPAAPAPAAPATAAEESFERPDVVSARLAAAALKREIQVLDQTTETSRTFVSPDGTLRTEFSPGPVRVQDLSGDWTPLDFDLVRSAGGWAPKASAVEVWFSDGGSGPVARIGSGADAVTMSWPDRLPAPVVSGATATYRLSATESLVLTANSRGYEQSLLLTAPPTTAPKMRLSFSGGASLHGTKGGSFGFSKRGKAGTRGKQLLEVAPPVMYSSAKDPKTGERTQVRPLAVATTAAADGASVMDVSAAMDFLTDPATQYPVTIDPVIASVTRIGDTYVQQGDTQPKVNDYSLFAGPTTAGVLRRAFLRFGAGSALAGTHVTNATLNLYTIGADTCTPKPLFAYPVTANFDMGLAVWTNQPTVSTAPATAASASFSSGGSTCARAWNSIDITAMTQGWADNPASDFGLQLRGDEADNLSGKRFCAMDVDASGQSASCTTTANLPYLSVTYNTIPGTPTRADWQPHIIGVDGAGTSTSLTPTFVGTASNADGTPYQLEVEVSHNPAYPNEGTGVMWTGTSEPTTPGAQAMVTAPAGTFSAGQHIVWRMRAKVPTAGGFDYSPWTVTDRFFFNINPPAVPTISCTTYVTGAWTAKSATPVTCTIDTTSTDGSSYPWSLNDPTPDTEVTATPNYGDPATITINPPTGWHTLYAAAKDTARHVSAVTSISFGVGVGGNLTPKDGDVTAKAVPLSASAPSQYTQVRYQWAPGTSTSFTDIPVARVTPEGSSTAITSWPRTGTTSGSTTTFTGLNWDVAATGAALATPLRSGVVQVRACFSSATLAQTCGTPRSFSLAQQIYAGSAPTADLGPGTVSLLTGDFQVSETDAAVGGLSIGRVATSLTPAAANTGPTGIFGPGWTASLPGTDAGYGDTLLIDNSTQGTMTIQSPDGTQVVYAQTATNTYTGTGETADGSVLRFTSTARNPANTADTVNYTAWQLTEIDGTVTTWLRNATTNQWLVAWVDQAGTEGETSFTRDAASGRVTSIFAPAPAGVTCTPASNNNPGCSVLRLVYATATTATGTTEATWGNFNGRLSKITWTGYDPGIPGMTTKDVASYQYDNTGRLRAAWDARLTTPLKTRYTYTGDRLATVTEPGRAAWTLTYDSSNRLASVARTDPDLAGAVARQVVVYNVPVSGVTGAPDVSGATAATWGQSTNLAYVGAAVFPASRVPGTPNASGVYAPAAADWPYADLTYADVNGRTVNTASYGAGAWQIDSTRYDANANVIWSLDDGNRAQALTPTASTDPYVASQASSAVRADLLATINTYSADGVNLISTLGPAHPAQLSNGTTASVRVKTTNTYDEGAPTTDPYRLVTRTVTTPIALDGATVPAADTKTVITGYNPINGVAATDPTSGWTLKAPTTVTTWMGTAADAANDLTTQTRYDAAGRAIETRLPGGTTTSPHTVKTTYYTTATNTTYPDCGGKPHYAGMICRVDPGGAPSAGFAVPVKEVTAYHLYGAPRIVKETSGTVVRTTTSDYDAAGRPTTTSIAVTGLTGSTPFAATTIAYDPNTGDATTTTQGADTISTTFDTFGRVKTYKDADTPTGATATYTYDIDGNVKTLNDGKGTYTYTYDSATERRGLVTSLNTGMGTAPSTFTGTYDAAGQLTRQTYPNGMTADYTYDNTGDTRTLNYTLPTYTGGPTAQKLTFTTVADADGSTVRAQSPLSAQDYAYDNADRLINVKDTANGACTTRTYAFTKQGDRTGLTTFNPNTDGTCQATTGTNVTSTFDTANRITNAGYTYDQLGRTLTVPLAGLASGSGPLTATYYDTDMPRTLTQTVNGTTQAKTFNLDPTGRYRTVIDTANAIESRRIRNRYADNGDSPAWIESSASGGATWTWQRNVVGIDGHLAATQPDAGTPALQIVNPGGDVVATVPDQVPTSGNPAGASASAYFESSEFGLRRIGANASSRYAWLGAHRRSADALAGVVLMGVRLYNPGTGRFLTVDPVPGGNENAYNYPNDPINKFDLDGRWSLWKKAALKALSAFKGAAPWTLRAGCATTGLGAWLCTAVVGGLLGMVVDLLRARIESGRWPSKTSAAISFALGAALAIGGKWWNKFRPSLVNAGYRLLGSVKSLLRRVGLGGLATAVGTYAAGGLTIAAGVRLSER